MLTTQDFAHSPLADVDVEELEARTQDSDVLEGRNIFEIFYAEQASWAEQAALDDAYVNNVQFTQEQIDALKERRQAPVPYNLIMPVIDLMVAMLTYNSPRYQATAMENSDRELAHVANQLLAWIWYISDGRLAFKNACYDYAVKGRGVMGVVQDFMADGGKGEVKVRDYDPYCVYPDPNSRDKLWRDASDIFVREMITDAQIRLHWPDMADLVIQGGAMTEDSRMPAVERVELEGQRLMGESQDSHYTRYEMLIHYRRIRSYVIEVIDNETQTKQKFEQAAFEAFRRQPAAIMVNQGQEKGYYRPGDLSQMMQLATQYGQPVAVIEEGVEAAYQITGPTPESNITILFGTVEMLLRRGLLTTVNLPVFRIREVVSIGGVLLYKRNLSTEHYPVVPFNNRHHRNPYPDSDVRFARPIQDSVNKTHALLIAHAATSTNVKVLVPRGTNVKELKSEFVKAGLGVAEYDPEFGPPVIAAPIPLSNELFAKIDRDKQHLYEIFGISPMMWGDATNAPETYRGTLQIEENGQRRMRGKTDDINITLTQLGRVTFDLSREVYTDEKILRLVQPNNIVRETKINELIYDDYSQTVYKLNDITSAEMDIQVVAGSTLASNRWALQEYYMSLFEMGAIDDIALLENSEIPNVEKILERRAAMMQMQQALAQAQEEIKDLKGEMQRRENELFQAKLGLKVERTANRNSEAVNKAVNRFDSASQLYDKELQLQLQQQQLQAQQAQQEQTPSQP